MKNTMKNVLGICFLILFLPYAITLLFSGRQGVGRQEKLPEREYEVWEMMLSEDLSCMDASTLRLLAVLKRTEDVYKRQEVVNKRAIKLRPVADRVELFLYANNEPNKHA